ncbi:MAG TPA: hypothetical protein VKC34_03090 [Blastocatellia bacterium]|nr:hypothetical protein [Blastocatellia bacterium]
MSTRLIKVMGGLIILLALYIGVHAVTALSGWEHRNKAALGIPDRTPYLELAVALFGLAIGLFIFLKKPKV